MIADTLEPDAIGYQHSRKIEQSLRQLRAERDIWEARALKYKAAFDTQTRRFQELLDICVATQAELENERMVDRLRQSNSNIKPLLRGMSTSNGRFSSTSEKALKDESTMGSAAILLNKPSSENGPGAGERVHSELAPIEARLLDGNDLRGCGPKWLFEALVQCSQVLELCDTLYNVQSCRSKVQYQRRLCLYHPGISSESKEVYGVAGATQKDDTEATEHCMCCIETEMAFRAKRRSAFEERRTVDQIPLRGMAQRNREKSKRRRISSQLRLSSSVKPAQEAIPFRWITPHNH